MFTSKLSRAEILRILNLPAGPDADAVFKQAREARREYTGDRIFAYGFVYFTTWCRNDCNFCYFRKSNDIHRYRKSTKETIDIAGQLADSGVNLIDLTMGEDPVYHRDHFDQLFTVLREIKSRTGLPVMVSPGVISHDLIDRLAEEGADWYALYQETHNRDLFRNLRVDQSYDERMDAKCYAAEKGMFIEEGLLAGCGESLEDLADSILTMGKIGASQIRVMSFVPQEGSPMEHFQSPDRQLELNVIAAMRLAYPWALIPASLDVDGIDGLEDRINAGSNVVTSIIPPHSGFVGVAHETMDVDEGGRTVKEARAILQNMGLQLASLQEYTAYLDRLRAMRED